MSDRVVVCCRSAESRLPARDYLAGSRALSEQAAAMGGRLISWGATVHAFEFLPDSIEDAIELSISVALDSVPGRRFSIGVSQGALEEVEDATARLPLVWGEPLVRAVLFARAAKPGDVLIDPIVDAVRRRELLTQGSRVVMYGKERLRALVLDIKHPWRSALAESVGALDKPPLVGRSEPGDMLVSAGTLGIVRARRGYGGTRFLDELGRALEPARVLRVTPHPFGEPLGALRRALVRGMALGQAPAAFSAAIDPSLDGLLAGEGLDLDSSAELVAAWLEPTSPHDPSGVVMLDDASEIDADTLEAVSQGAVSQAAPFRVVARLGEEAPIPAALAPMTLHGETHLSTLSVSDAARLARACMREELDERSAARWGNRGGGVPLGIVEAVYEALESGELVWEDGRAARRLRGAGPRTAQPAKHWIKRRLALLEPDARALVEALAAFGGEAETRDAGALIKAKTNFGLDVAAACAVLETAGWVVRVRPDLLALASATHRDAVLSSLESDELASWHRAASVVLEAREAPLSIAAAATHAVLAGDRRRAIELARRAAAAAHAAGLERTARSFERFAETSDVRWLLERQLLTMQHDAARALPSMWPEPAGTERASSIPPDEAVRSARLEAMAMLRRGETAEAIRVLRREAEEAKAGGGPDRCRALLALGVALATADRRDEALLAALDGLARAREAADDRGEQACARFLAQLSEKAGDARAARAWLSVAGS